MTPIEVLKEIRKLPIAEKRRVFDELKQDLALAETGGFTKEEKRFLEAMQRKGLIIEPPPRTANDEQRRGFKPIKVTGEPVSETIIKERG